MTTSTFSSGSQLKDEGGQMALSFEDVPVDRYPLQPEGTGVDA